MYMSSAMNSNLAKLLDVNSELQVYQNRAITGKRINSASDGLAAYLTAQGFDSRATRLSSINDGLTTVLSSVTSAKQGLSQIRKTLSELRDTLKAASESQAQAAATGQLKLPDSDPSNTQFNIAIAQRKGGGGGDALTWDSTFTSVAAGIKASGNSAVNQLYFGDLAVRAGTTLSFTAGEDTWTFNLAQSTAGATPPAATDVDSTKTSTVYTLGQLKQKLFDKLGIRFELNSGGAVWQNTGSFVYDGPSYGLNASGQVDLTAKKGVRMVISSSASTGSDPIGANQSYRADGTVANLDLSTMIQSNRTAKSSLVYVEDVKEPSTTNPLTDLRVYGSQRNTSSAQAARTADPARANAARAYRLAVQNINNFARDASTSGVNLLLGDQLRATLNEDGTGTELRVVNLGNNTISFTSSGLSLVDSNGGAADAAQNFSTNGTATLGLLSAIEKVDAALVQVDSGVGQVANFEVLIQGRKDFNGALTKLLNQATIDLTGADAAETAARASSLQIQQSFAQSILSTQKQADQSLLQLLR